MKKQLMLLLLTMSSLANADVYKCQSPTEKITYQSIPCSTVADQRILPINAMRPKQMASEQLTSLKVWQDPKLIMIKNGIPVGIIN